MQWCQLITLAVQGDRNGLQFIFTYYLYFTLYSIHTIVKHTRCPLDLQFYTFTRCSQSSVRCKVYNVHSLVISLSVKGDTRTKQKLLVEKPRLHRSVQRLQCFMARCDLEQFCDGILPAPSPAESLGQAQHQLPAHHLVPVDVPHDLHLADGVERP